jgi:tetratricopeptide (TPR) repeat protein
VREADAAYARDDYKTARGLYEQAVAAGADALHPLSRLARLQSWDGDLDASIDNYRRALTHAPDDVDLLLEYARVLTWKNDLKEAILRYEELRDRRPDDAGFLAFGKAPRRGVDRSTPSTMTWRRR